MHHTCLANLDHYPHIEIGGGGGEEGRDCELPAEIFLATLFLKVEGGNYPGGTQAPCFKSLQIDKLDRLLAPTDFSYSWLVLINSNVINKGDFNLLLSVEMYNRKIFNSLDFFRRFRLIILASSTEIISLTSLV